MKNNYKLYFRFLFYSIFLVIFIVSCSTYYFRKQYDHVNSLLYQKDSLQKNTFLKAHFKNGEIIIFENNWTYDSTEQYISGTGIKYDFNRRVIDTGALQVNIDSVAIFETNKRPKERIAGLAVVTVLDALIAIPCLLIPKACFGSCPTFYLKDGNHSSVPLAEGFSNAISPSMEYSDLDALGSFYSQDNGILITMKNEALETHCIKDIRLIAFPVDSHETVFHTKGNDFYRSSIPVPPVRALGPEGDITYLLNKPDRIERSSAASSKNLVEREEIFLEFSVSQPISAPGLVLHFRQSLMTTYMIYSALSYMGDQAGEIFASIENGQLSADKLENGIYKALGDIDVYVFNEKNQSYQYLNGFYETGPIAINQQIMALTTLKNQTTFKIKLILNRGLWRIDYAGLTPISGTLNPLSIPVSGINQMGANNLLALSALKDSAKHWITLPGSQYELLFELPFTQCKYELFLYSKGYYLEWIRHSWLADKNLLKLNRMIEHPQKYLKEITGEYKNYEAEMEHEFWNSKINKNSFIHENY